MKNFHSVFFSLPGNSGFVLGHSHAGGRHRRRTDRQVRGHAQELLHSGEELLHRGRCRSRYFLCGKITSRHRGLRSTVKQRDPPQAETSDFIDLLILQRSSDSVLFACGCCDIFLASCRGVGVCGASQAD